MMISIKESVLQALLIALNFIFALLSISLIGLGIVYNDDLTLVETYVNRMSFLKLPTLLIILGSLSFASSLAGCYFLRNYSQRYLQVYLVFLTILLAAELTIGCLAFINVQDTSATTEKTRTKMAHLLEFDNATEAEFFVLEEHFRCCGIDSVEDYLKDELLLINDTICADIFYHVSGQDFPGCAITVVENIIRISLEIFGCMSVFAILQIIDIACVLMMVIRL